MEKEITPHTDKELKELHEQAHYQDGQIGTLTYFHPGTVLRLLDMIDRLRNVTMSDLDKRNEILNRAADRNTDLVLQLQARDRAIEVLKLTLNEMGSHSLEGGAEGWFGSLALEALAEAAKILKEK